MKLKNILDTVEGDIEIMYRCNMPGESVYDEDTMLEGYALWVKNKLVSLDGDSYSLDDEIVRYEYYISNETHKRCLCVIEEVEWLSN